MKIAIVAATEFELAQIRQIQMDQHELSFFVHGIGMMSAMYHLQKIAENKPDLLLQCGIAGTYDVSIEVGHTVLVLSEKTDVGAEDDQALLDLFDLEFLSLNEFPYKNGALPCPFLENHHFDLQTVHGLTVNCSSGSISTIEKRSHKYNISIETMEGAALHYVGLMNNIPFLQVRTISNRVEKRNKLHWDIPIALKNNTTSLMKILSGL